MPPYPQESVADMASLLGWLYLIVSAMNLAAVWVAARRRKHRTAGAWLLLAATFALSSGLAFCGRPPAMPEAVKNSVDAMLGPVTFTLSAYVGLCVFYLGRRFFVLPAVAWAGLNASLLAMGLSLTDPEYAALVTRPENVPIVAMVYLLGFFTWLAAAAAVENDRRLATGSSPREKQEETRFLVWPDLVYIELICMILIGVLLVVWSLGLKAPLEQPANPVVTPNPSKAPWYFLGLQEMLVFSDPWNVGVVVPCLIVLGLMAIPYLDFNPQGNGYYTIGQRRFAYLVFQFGFLALWVLLILIGTFMRGPNWNFFGPYEVRDAHKVIALSNVTLSECFWVILLDRNLPQVPADVGTFVRFGHVLWREIAGVLLMAAYFLGLPPLLGRTILGRFRRQMGFGRYTLMSLLLLMMWTLPLKMILRWTLNLSYIVNMPEYFLNF